jgi:hypothetical protein
MFTSYLSRSESWKNLTNWTFEDLEDSSPGQKRPASFADALKGELSAEKLFGAVKRQVSRGVTRKTSGFVSKMIRKMIK